VTGQTRNTIKSITGDRAVFAIHYESEALDAKGNPADKKNPLILNFRIIVANDVTYFDMKDMFGAIAGLDDVEASGTAMRIPNNLTVGQKIDDAAARVRIGFINCSAVMTEGQCEAIEDITVEAGAFKCYKISQKNNVTAMGIRRSGTTCTWYAKGIGAVKTETYDNRGNLLTLQELKTITN
jgi:hypothetical protein